MIEWIKCTNELPEEGTCALFYFPTSWDNKPKIMSLILSTHKWMESENEMKMKHLRTLDLNRSYRLEESSHWMPLPEFPKEE